MKAITLTTLSTLAALTLTLGCATTTARVRPTATSPVPAVDDRNLIFPAERATDLFGGYAAPVEGFWTPDEAQVHALRADLAPYLVDHTPSERTRPRGTDAYYAQFVGIERDGRQLIHANFFCDDLGLDWHQDLFIVMDGGSCFFNVEYEPATGAYQHLYINGEA